LLMLGVHGSEATIVPGSVFWQTVTFPGASC